jgi:hypothetical protein
MAVVVLPLLLMLAKAREAAGRAPESYDVLLFDAVFSVG